MKQALTLVELLVVIAIIAFLAALLMPVIATVRQQAKSINCLAQFRQMGFAVGAYALDNKGAVVQWSQASTHWQSSLIPYFVDHIQANRTSAQHTSDLMKSRSGLHCPAFRTALHGGQPSGGYGMKSNHWINTTTAKLNQFGAITPGVDGPVVRLVEIHAPSRVILAGDSVSLILRADSDYGCRGFPTVRAYFWHSSLIHDDGKTCWNDNVFYLTPGVAGSPNRHGKAANYLFYDGSAKSLAHRTAAAAVGRYPSDMQFIE